MRSFEFLRLDLQRALKFLIFSSLAAYSKLQQTPQSSDLSNYCYEIVFCFLVPLVNVVSWYRRLIISLFETHLLNYISYLREFDIQCSIMTMIAYHFLVLYQVHIVIVFEKIFFCIIRQLFLINFSLLIFNQYLEAIHHFLRVLHFLWGRIEQFANILLKNIALLEYQLCHVGIRHVLGVKMTLYLSYCDIVGQIIDLF